MKRFEFVEGDEIVIAPGRTVKRIRAIVEMVALGVASGDLGGRDRADRKHCRRRRRKRRPARGVPGGLHGSPLQRRVLAAGDPRYDRRAL